MPLLQVIPQKARAKRRANPSTGSEKLSILLPGRVCSHPSVPLLKGFWVTIMINLSCIAVYSNLCVVFSRCLHESLCKLLASYNRTITAADLSSEGQRSLPLTTPAPFSHCDVSSCELKVQEDRRKFHCAHHCAYRPHKRSPLAPGIHSLG